MLLDLNDLWNSHDEREWLIALDRGRLNLVGRKDRNLVQFIHSIDLEYVRGLGTREWYAFLIKYFHWQFTGNHLQQRLRDLDKNSFEQLFSVKCNLVTIHQSELVDARKCLNLIRTPRIRGLDYPGASGMLALLFKEWFGTVDSCILESLQAIQSLPEKSKMHDLRAWVTTKSDWRDRDAVLVIEIMRRKADQLNTAFSTNKWTPSSISTILSTSNRSTRKTEESADAIKVQRL